MADNPDDVEACDSYTLPALTNGAYFTGTGGVGPIAVGTEITETQTIYVYTAASGSCTDAENSFLVIITPCEFEAYCSYTQGFYGNEGGKGCTPDDGLSTAYDMMYAAIDGVGGQYEFGSGANVFTLYLSDIENGNIFKMLPGGGKASALKGPATYDIGTSWKNVPLIEKGKTIFNLCDNRTTSKTDE